MNQSNFKNTKDNPNKGDFPTENTKNTPNKGDCPSGTVPEKVNNCIKNSFILRHFLCFFVFLLLLIYLFLSCKEDTRTYYFLSNLKIMLPALITAAGVFEGFNINRKKSFKEIVTKERIKWLHRIHNNLTEYLKLSRNGEIKREDKDKVTELYYKIIFNINHEDDIEALNAIKHYNEYIFAKELEKYILIKEGIIEIESIETHEVKKYTYYEYIKNYEELRNEVEKSFIKVFKEVWEKIKNEAD